MPGCLAFERSFAGEQEMIVPHESLRPETLTALIEEFVTREGAIHGRGDEIDLSQKVATVRAQLKAGRTVIVYDEIGESCTFVPRENLPSLP